MDGKELDVTLKTLEKMQRAAQGQIDNLKTQIEKMEQTLKQPYICTKERPYFLHAIMVHDGVAEQGHYFTFIYDRVKKMWWKLNDHNVCMELESDVFRVAFGGEGHSSACNLIYMSKHIADQIDLYKKPLFTEQHAEFFNIAKPLKRSIQEQNYRFTIQQQNFVVTHCVQKINSTFKARLNRLEEEEQSLNTIEEMKLHSFFHYLKNVGFNGYAKWMTLNQCFKEEHPQGLDIVQLQKNEGNEQHDVIYTELLKHYQDRFLSLTQQEQISIQTKQSEYKELLKKAEIIVFIMMNFNTKMVAHIFQAYMAMNRRSVLLTAQMQHYARISNYDSICQEIIQVYIVRLLLNMSVRFTSEKKEERREALLAAQLCAIIAE